MPAPKSKSKSRSKSPKKAPLEPFFSKGGKPYQYEKKRGVWPYPGQVKAKNLTDEQKDFWVKDQKQCGEAEGHWIPAVKGYYRSYCSPIADPKYSPLPRRVCNKNGGGSTVNWEAGKKGEHIGTCLRAQVRKVEDSLFAKKMAGRAVRRAARAARLARGSGNESDSSSSGSDSGSGSVPKRKKRVLHGKRRVSLVDDASSSSDEGASGLVRRQGRSPQRIVDDDESESDNELPAPKAPSNRAIAAPKAPRAKAIAPPPPPLERRSSPRARTAAFASPPRPARAAANKSPNATTQPPVNRSPRKNLNDFAGTRVLRSDGVKTRNMRK